MDGWSSTNVGYVEGRHGGGGDGGGGVCVVFVVVEVVVVVMITTLCYCGREHSCGRTLVDVCSVLQKFVIMTP